MLTATLTLKGEAPLVMHNARMADPLDEHARKLASLTGKRGKKLEDHELIARVEFEGGLYIDPDVGPYLPGENILKSLVEGARLTKRGKEVERAVVLNIDVVPLIYDGPRDVQGLYDAGFLYRKTVGVGKSRTVRTRPKFDEWAVSTDIYIDASRLDLSDVEAIADAAGAYIGLCERRPRFGRFLAVIEGGQSNGKP